MFRTVMLSIVIAASLVGGCAERSESESETTVRTPEGTTTTTTTTEVEKTGENPPPTQ